jgi:DNA-binding beta-propeller fold protein YncE
LLACHRRSRACDDAADGTFVASVSGVVPLAVVSRQRPVTSIEVRVDPGALAYDIDTETLYVADDRNHAVLRIRGDHHAWIGEIPSGEIVARSHLGQIALAPDGGIYVPRLGYGTAGAVFVLRPGRAPTTVPGLDPRFWYLAAVSDCTDDAVLVTRCRWSQSGAFAGEVVRVTPDGDVATVCDGLLEPTGIALLGPSIVVTDTRAGALVHIDRFTDGVARSMVVTGLPQPGAITPASSDSVFVACRDPILQIGSVAEVDLDGGVRVVAQGPCAPRGIASDGNGKLYVSTRNQTRVMIINSMPAATSRPATAR